MKNIIRLAGVFLLLFGCSKHEDVYTLKSGQTLRISNNLLLRVESINDSRCPTGVDCAWQGTASVQFHFVTKKEKYDFTLTTSPGFNDTVIEDIKIQLINVLPYPVHNKKQPVKTVIILVGKN